MSTSSLLAEAESVIERAERAKRTLTASEKTLVKENLAKAEMARFGTDLRSIRGGFQTPGEVFVNSPEYKGLKVGGTRPNKWSSGAVEYKAPSASTLSGVNSEVTFADQRPGVIPTSLRRLTVADLLAQGTTSSNAITYRQEESGSAGSVNAAAAVAEAGQKPESRLRLQPVTDAVRKIATVLAVTDEMLEDEEQIRSFIDDRLRTYIALEEEDQLLNGSGTAPNISGILDRDIQTGTQASLADGPLDAVHKAITQIRLVEEEPSGIVVNPSDWEIFRLAKDLNEQYYGGGPFTAAYGNSGGLAGNSLWSLPVVVTASIAEGTLLVGAFKTGAQLFRRSGITIEATNSHGDNFAYDVTVLRAESRLALAVYKPDAFYAITGVEAESA